MAQHKLSEKKSKANLPSNVQKKKNKKPQNKGPKKGRQMVFAPKKKEALEQAKVHAEVTKVINKRNEEMLRERVNKNTGRHDKVDK